jgi:hypothetical protein
MTAKTIACALAVGERGDRRQRWRRLAEQGSGHVVETATGLRLVLTASEDVQRELRELVELERECCAFATWTIARAGSQLVLDMEAEGEAVAAVHGMLRGFRATFAGAA